MGNFKFTKPNRTGSQILRQQFMVGASSCPSLPMYSYVHLREHFIRITVYKTHTISLTFSKRESFHQIIAGRKPQQVPFPAPACVLKSQGWGCPNHRGGMCLANCFRKQPEALGKSNSFPPVSFTVWNVKAKPNSQGFAKNSKKTITCPITMATR